jgi:hypothetical protein
MQSTVVRLQENQAISTTYRGNSFSGQSGALENGGQKKDKIWPSCHFRSQELFKQGPANIANFRCAVFEERHLPEGQMAEGKSLAANSLCF